MDARVDADLLERHLERQRIHYCRQHAHVIGSCAVEALGGRSHAPEDVAAADDETEFMSLPLRFGDFPCKAGDRNRIDAKLPLSHQCLARKLQQDPVEPRVSHSARLSLLTKRRTRFSAPAPFSNC